MFLTEMWEETISKIDISAKKAGRSLKDVNLVAVSKTKPVEDVQLALNCGQLVFGENKVQEALRKFPELKKANPDIKLHLIGPLQSNKVKDVVQHFDVVQTVDRVKLVDALSKEMIKQNRSLECYIQVNTGEESQKAGISVEEVANLVNYSKKAGLNVTGLMCIPPVGDNPAPHFALLKKLADEHGLKDVSMGMSADYETAVELGATHVRVGSALFGSRLPIV
jgi:pyridoxal phosphate enzyme (YggS family)